DRRRARRRKTCGSDREPKGAGLESWLQREGAEVSGERVHRSDARVRRRGLSRRKLRCAADAQRDRSDQRSADEVRTDDVSCAMAVSAVWDVTQVSEVTPLREVPHGRDGHGTVVSVVPSDPKLTDSTG